MKNRFRNPVLKTLSSLRLAAILMAIFAAAIGVATFLEARYGRDGAYALVYAAPWFEALLGLLTLNLTLSLIGRFPYPPRLFGFFLVHVGMIVILVGAGITRYFGYEGTMPIREGQSSNVVYTTQNYVQARQDGTLQSFPVRMFRPGPQNEHAKITLGGQDFTLGVSEFYPGAEEAWVPGPGGEAAVVHSVRGERGMERDLIFEGDSGRVGGFDVHFRRGAELQPLAGDSPYGELRVRAGDESCTFTVRNEPGVLGRCGGYLFETAEFHSNFRVGADPDPDGPLRNPMLKVAITSPDGEVGERMLFALHPEFAMGHAGQQDAFQQLDLLYTVNTGVEIARKTDGVFVMRAPFGVAATPMQGGETATYEAGTEIPLEERMLYSGTDNDFRFAPMDLADSLVRSLGPSDNPNAPPAARLYLEADGERQEVAVMRGAPGKEVTVAGQTARLSYGPIVKELPYSLYLEDFVLETYPGSDNPASYESHVLLNDPAHGIEGRPVRIWMNHPLNYGGSKHFQSSYDRDRRGTILSVNHDPGKLPTYVGYGILTLGFIVLWIKELVERRRGKDRRQATVSLGMAAVLALMVLPAGSALAQMDDHAGHDHGAATTGAVHLTPELREDVSQLIVQDFQGRMKPLDTLAREMVMKITKKQEFQGQQPVDMVLDFAVHPQAWWNRPVIAVRNSGVKEMLGVSPQTTHVSLASLIDDNGYKLQSEVELAHRLPGGQRNKAQQKLIVFDERVHLLYLSLQGSMLRMYPVPDDPKHTWRGIEEATASAGPEVKAEYDAAFASFFGGLETNNTSQIRQGIQQTVALQQKYGGKVVPDQHRIDAELTLNSLKPFQKATIPYLLGFLLLIAAYFHNLFRHDGRRFSFKQPLYLIGMILFAIGVGIHTYGFVLRWIASARAPLSNGHESLLFIALAVGWCGLLFEIGSRQGAAGALGSLLTAIVLGISMLSTFDPAIGPLVPVLASYWLNIHVSIITASYGFLGLAALLGILTIVLMIVQAGARRDFGAQILKLDRLNADVMTVGLGLLAIGTLLGGVWANESWGRYWGWDPKETWALVSILVYAVVLHFRWIPKLRNPFVHAAGSVVAVSSIVMTYFGVNYFLTGLHSYASGDAAQVPGWVFIGSALMLSLIAAGWAAWRQRPATQIRTDA